MGKIDPKYEEWRVNSASQFVKPELLDLDIHGIRSFRYSDAYFRNAVRILYELAKQGYRFGGTKTDLSDFDVDVSNIDIGNIVVRQQYFTRQKPWSIVVGSSFAKAVLENCVGWFDDMYYFHNTYENCQIWGVRDGFRVTYDGKPMNVIPILVIEGRYRDFGPLETVLIGAFTQGTRIATQVYKICQAGDGHGVAFFPARFEYYKSQPLSGYAYYIGVQRYNFDYDEDLKIYVSTDAQADWFGGCGGGTTAHALVQCFLGDSAEMMMAHAKIVPVEYARILLSDFHNDNISDTLITMERMFFEYLKWYKKGNMEMAKKYILHGVRPDNSGNLVDVCLQREEGNSREDYGVNPQLIKKLSTAIKNAWREWDLASEDRKLAQWWCERVGIFPTGGYKVEKLRKLVEKGAEFIGIGYGSDALSNCSKCGTNADFTADNVAVYLPGEKGDGSSGEGWYQLAKVGRKDNLQLNPQLERWN